jgi:hypothetical protein
MNTVQNDDETLTIINQPKHPKPRGIQGTKWKECNVQEDKRKNH